MKKSKLPKSIELHNGQSLDLIIEYAKELGESDFSKIIIDIEAFIEHQPYSGRYATCEVKLKRTR